MNRSTVILGLLVLSALAPAQWLERTFRLTDSFPNLYDNVVAFINPITGRVYLGGDYRTHVFDPATGAKRYFTEGASGGFLHYGRVGKVFGWADPYYVWAYDDRADTLHSLWFETDERMVALELNRRRGKFYASTEDGIEVFDAWTGQHRATIDLYPEGQYLAWDSATDRLFCAAYHRVHAVDCGNDSVAGFIDGVDADALVDHPLRREIIAANWNSIYFCSADSLKVLDSIRLPFQLDHARLFVDRNAGRMYAANVYNDFAGRDGFWWSETVAVIDLATDSLCALALLGDSTRVMDATLSERDGRLYVRDYYNDSLYAVGPDGSVAALAHLGQYYWAAFGTAWHPAQDRIYAVTRDTLFGVDRPTGAVVTRVPYVDVDARWLSWHQATGRLYLGNEDGFGWVGAGDTVERWHPAGPLDLVAQDTAAGLFFLLGANFLGDGRMVTYDCIADSLRPERSYPLSYTRDTLFVPELNRLYLWTGNCSLLVYDTGADSFLSPILVGAQTSHVAYNHHNGLLYLVGYERNTVNLVELDAARGIVLRRAECRVDGEIAVNPARNELWQARTSYPASFLAVFPCSTLQYQSYISVPHAFGRMAVDSTRNKVYCIGAWVTVVDCSSRAVIREIDVGLGASVSWYFDEFHGKLYIGNGTRHIVIDCDTDSIVAALDVPGKVMTADPENNRLYAYSSFSDQVSVIRDTTPIGVAEGRSPLNASRITPAATLIRGSLILPSAFCTLPSDFALLDASGRRVLALLPGPNDVSALPPGVYFVRSTIDNRRSTMAKVVLAR